MVAAYLLLFTFLHQVFGESCVFPSYMDGNWSDSKFYAVQFFDRNLMFLPDYSISRVGSTTNMTCYLNQGNQYVLRTTKIINATANGKPGDYYFYICMEITQITSYSFYYYLQTEADLNNERTVAIANNIAPAGLSAICTETISVQLYHIMVKDGFETEALQTCSTPLLRNYNFELSGIPDTCLSRGRIEWTEADSSQKIFNISYVFGSNCNIKLGNSETSKVGCLLCIKSDTTFITSMVNLDNNVDDVYYYKFTCVMSSSDKDNITLTQRARVCHSEQTALTIPASLTTPIYPRGNTVAAIATLSPNGEPPTAKSNCFPRTSTPKRESSTSLAWLAAVVIIILLIIFAVAGFIYWWKRLKRKWKVHNKGSLRRRNFKIDLRTAMLAGLGSSRQRQKSFLRQEGRNILIIQNDKKSETKGVDLLNGTIASSSEEENIMNENSRPYERKTSMANTVHPLSDISFDKSTNENSDSKLEIDNTCDVDRDFEQTETIPPSVLVFPTKDNVKRDNSVVGDITDQNTSQDVTETKENIDSTIWSEDNVVNKNVRIDKDNVKREKSVVDDITEQNTSRDVMGARENNDLTNFSKDNLVHKNKRVAVGRLKNSTNLVTEKQKPHSDIKNARKGDMKIENYVVQNDLSYIPPTENNHEANSQQQIGVENDSPNNGNENYVVQHDPYCILPTGNIHETNSQQHIRVENDSSKNVNERYEVQTDPSFIPHAGNIHGTNSQQQMRIENDSSDNVNEPYVVQTHPSCISHAVTNSQRQIGVENDSFVNVKYKPLVGSTDGFQQSRVDLSSDIASLEDTTSTSHNTSTSGHCFDNIEISNSAKITSRPLEGVNDHVRFSTEEKQARKSDEKNTGPNKDSSRPNSVGIEKLQLDRLHVSDHKFQNEKKLKMRKQLMKKKSPFAGTKNTNRK